MEEEGISMKQIDLFEYKGFQRYFIFFDIVIKKDYSNKELFLESLNIAPSSYRRAKKFGNMIGEKILIKLCHKFHYQMINENLITDFAQRLNKIYFNIYYKKYDLYDEDMAWLNEMLTKNYLFYPVLLMFKLLMALNSKDSPRDLIKQNEDIYAEIMQFEPFFNDDLKYIYEIIQVAFIENVATNPNVFNYKNELSYYTLSSKLLLAAKYIESLYFSEKAKERFLQEENYKRVYYINLNIMANFNYLKRYNDCYNLAQKQLITLEAQNLCFFEYNNTRKHFVIACLGLGKYKEIIDILDDINSLNMTELCSLCISYYKTNKNEYNNFFNGLINNNVHSREDIYYFENLNRFILKKDKEALEVIKASKIAKSLCPIIEKM